MAQIYLHSVGSTSKETSATKSLVKQLREDLSDYEGHIWLIPSIDLHVGTGRHDVDLIMIGYLKDYFLDQVGTFNNVEVKSFFATIELKSHTANGLHPDGTHLKVDYPEGSEDVTKQSNDQKQSIITFLTEHLKNIRVPIISNLIWLTGTTTEDFEKTVKLTRSNILCSDSSTEEFFCAIARQSNLRTWPNVHSFHSNYSEDNVKKVADIFCAKGSGADTMTLRRINLLKHDIVKTSDIENSTEKVVVLSGHAGTGKTIMLLQAADRLSQKGYKCLFLTYNIALISDLKRTMSFLRSGEPTFPMESMHSFLMGLMRKANIWDNTKDINSDFDPSLTVLLNTKERHNINLDYQYVFVDEAQDWKQASAEVLKYYCKNSKIIIADGIDQFMHSNEHSDWGESPFPKLKTNLRQRANLVAFAKIFASKLGIFWDVDSCLDVPGGNVIITNSYDDTIHKNLLSEAKSHGCTAYDIMLLAPKSLTTSGQFDALQAYNGKGIHLYDGVCKANRDKLYGENNALNEESRVYTYESCRGLEAWTTVCLRFDQLFTEPHHHDYSDIKYAPARQYMLGLWSLIPLTRAVDTLVLCVQKGSSIDKILREIAEENKDFVKYKVS